MYGDGITEEINTLYNVGKYTTIRKLGEGGEGCVYLARDEEMNRLVALKRIGESAAARVAGEGTRIIKEADYLQKLRHPMFPVIYDLIWDNACYIVMEYIQGITLRECMERNGCVGEEKACVWAKQLLDVLQYLHTRKPPVIYRDLKPDNIMVCPDGHLRLVDFGAAGRRSYGTKEGEGTEMAATPGYGAPEQFGGRTSPVKERRKDWRSVSVRAGADAGDNAGETAGENGVRRKVYADERSDIYAFGKVLYYMLTGADPAKPPYTSLAVRDYQPLVRERMERLIRKCIREEPQSRYQMIEEVRTELNKCGRRGVRLRRRDFIRAVEKRVWLTEQ